MRNSRNVGTEQLQSPKASVLVFLGCTLLLATQCQTPPEPIAQSTMPPPEVKVVNVSEENTVINEITQHKLFNQCDSASLFRAQIQFSQSSTRETRQELVLGVTIGGEVGISEVAKVQLVGAIEQHFASSISQEKGHEEGVAIEVPPHTQQEYIIVWRENRREGTVEYIEDGESKIADFSYRLGLELVSATGKDVACPGQESSEATAIPTQTPRPTYTPYPTYTHPPSRRSPTATPRPSPTPRRDTMPGTILSPGEPWREEDVVMILSNVDIRSETIMLELTCQNNTGQVIVFDWDFDINVLVQDNLGNIYSTGSGSHDKRVSLDHGEHTMLFDMQFRGPLYQQDVTHITLTIRDISRIDEATWEIPIFH